MTEVTISEVYETINKHNPISGHHWTEQGRLKGYEVSGGWFTTTFHRRYAAAEKEKSLREGINKKFPFDGKNA